MNKLIDFINRYTRDSAFRSLVENDPTQVFAQSNLDPKTQEQVSEFLKNPDDYRGKSVTRPQNGAWW